MATVGLPSSTYAVDLRQQIELDQPVSLVVSEAVVV